MSDSYSQKQLTISVTIEDQRMTFEGFATQVHIKKQASPELPTMTAQLFGLSEDHLAQLTMLSFNALSMKKNVIEVEAGEDGVKSTVFVGEITNSLPDFNAAPSPALNIEAITAAYPKLQAASPVAVNGSQSAASLCEAFAKEAGFTFRNAGVTASVENAVINGDPVSKMQWIATAVGADLIFDDKEVALVPVAGHRGEAQGNVTVISPETGAVGYPSFDSMGIKCKTFFRPDLMVGGTCRIESLLPRATGQWKIYSLEHSLSANMPSGGDWFTTFSATWLGD